MSTRSGKRRNGSLLGNTVISTDETVFKSERKTRNRRVKENCENVMPLKTKKRHNYVSYPSEEDNTEKDASRSTLKEQDLNISTNIEPVVDTGKTVRLTRRTKKFAENGTENSFVDENLEEITKHKKKSKISKKKNQDSATEAVLSPKECIKNVKKSKNKKGKKNAKRVMEEEPVVNKSLNESIGSIDSFHSAAGSPVKKKPSVENVILNSSFGKSPRRASKRCKPDSFISEHEDLFPDEKHNSPKKRKLSTNNITLNQNRNSQTSQVSQIINTTIEKQVIDTEVVLNTTFEKETPKKRKSCIKNLKTTIEKIDTPQELDSLNLTYEKSDSTKKLNETYEEENKGKRKSVGSNAATTEESEKVSLNSTFDKSKESDHASLNATFNKETKLNSTFDKTETHSNTNTTPKSSLTSSDGIINVTFDKSNDCIISITSNDSSDNIINTTPVLIESSMDESFNDSSEKNVQTPKSMNVISTSPLKREGTFTKDSSDLVVSPKPKLSTEKTPIKRMSLPSPGSTPFPFSKSSQKEKSILNVTHSIEKSTRRSSLVEPPPRLTRVMFCSPINNPVVVSQLKKKVIKSNLKGSNKSFIHDESAAERARAAPRKRSFTHNDADDARAKRSRLAADRQHGQPGQSGQPGQHGQPGARASRPRTLSATVKSSEPMTPSKKPSTPAKKVSPKKSDAKLSRTKLPNFAALHQKRFQMMESLDECQARKARRARQLLTPKRGAAVSEGSSLNTSKGPATTQAGRLVKDTKKTDTPTKASKLPTLESLRPGFTRFGFKMNVDNNPFNVSKPEPKPKEQKPNSFLSRLPTLPSLAGATSRKEMAKQVVMREKSFTSLLDKRDVTRKENRTTIKGVRTNRRFELQMQLRNINS